MESGFGGKGEKGGKKKVETKMLGGTTLVIQQNNDSLPFLGW